jgi:hypothetical protein
VEDLLKPENRQKLVNVLKYHVVSGRVYDTDAVQAGSAATLLGQSIQVSVSEAGLKINGAVVVAKNIEASNGVVHAFDSVLLPSQQPAVSAQLSPTDAIGMLNNAVSQGVPQFNSGHHQSCCDTYMTVLTKIQQTGVQGVPSHTMTMIQNTLANAQADRHTTNRAWTLRRGIDSTMAQLRQMPVVSISP